jgi:predicted amidohydrolase
VAESIPGPTSQVLGEMARRYRLYVVAGIYEREGPVVYNTALLIDREGKVAGKYRKIHLPETEVSGGLTPGKTYPVFKTDFGIIGIEICYDNFFPEVARSLALQGAELILLPIWGDGRGQGNEWDIVSRARAIDNAVYLVASNYSNKRSFIINPNGRILADTGGESGLVTAEIDLDARTFERWLSVGSYGEWKNLFPRERRIETYQLLVGDHQE